MPDDNTYIYISHINNMHYDFEGVQSFVYLGSLVNETNDTTEEISK